jgi:hypothetical protein
MIGYRFSNALFHLVLLSHPFRLARTRCAGRYLI